MGSMKVLGQRGDTKIHWNSDNEAEVEMAEKTFNSYKEKGFAIFTIRGKGVKGERIQKFFSGDEALIVVPPIAGG